MAVLLRAGLLVVLTVMAYWPALHGTFIWDDFTFIADNNLIHSPDGLFKIWFGKESTDYWPVIYSLCWFLWRLWGSEPFGYHALNLLIHVGNALLIWRILHKLEVRWGYLAALLFAVHPVNVEAVAWIFQLKTTLATAFVLVATLFWLDGRAKSYWISVGLFALALLTKTSVITWPVVLLGHVWFTKKAVTRQDILKLAPFFLLSLAAGIVGIFWYPFEQLTGGEVIRAENFAERMLSAGRAFWFYVGKILWPVNLTFIYPRWTVSLGDHLHFVPLVAMVAAMIALYKRSLFYCLAFFALAIFPVMGFFDIYFMRYSYVADHWAYLAVPGIVCAAVILMRGHVLAYLLVPVLCFLSFQQAKIYADEETIWRDTLSKNSDAWMAHNNLGNLMMGKNPQEAFTHFKEVMRLKPDGVDSYLNLGVWYLGQDNLVTAQEYLVKALDVFPYNARALNNLAAIAMRNGDMERAAQLLELAVQHLPTYQLGFKNLGIVRLNLRQREAAVAAFRRAVELRADDLEAKRSLEAALRMDAASH